MMLETLAESLKMVLLLRHYEISKNHNNYMFDKPCD